MNSIKKILLRESTFYVALAVFFMIRVTYALSRDLFASGPDAPKYMKAPLDLVKFGFWSSQIEGAPTYPLGYPVVLSPLVQIGGTRWIILAQILQVILSIATVYLVYNLSLIFLKKEISLLIGYIFLLSPAFTPMSGEAMYEPLLMFVFYLYLSSVLKLQNSSRNIRWFIALGVLAGAAIVIHPRIIPWILFIQLILFRKIGLGKSVIFFSSLSPIVILFVIRNKIAHESWTLSDAADSWISDIRPGNFVALFRDGIVNAIYFWSPYSGDAKRGTWMHNFTLYHEIKKITHSATIVTLIAVIFAIIAIFLWLFGSLLLMRSQIPLGNIVFFIPLLAWITDILTIGDSRHRLVVVPLLLIGQVQAITQLRGRKSNSLKDLNIESFSSPSQKPSS